METETSSIFCPNQTNSSISSENPGDFADTRILVPLVIIFLFSLPASSGSFVGALQAFRKQEGCTVNAVIVFYNFGILQTCLVTEVCMLLRWIAWGNGRVSVPAVCATMHFSVAFGSTAVQAGLTVVTIFRYICVFHPRTGAKMNAKKGTVALSSTFLLTCLGIARGTVDFYINGSSVFQQCLGNCHRSYLDPERLYYVSAFFVITLVVDFILTARISYSVHKTRHQVAALSTAAMARRKQKNILTLRGSVVCRLVAMIPILPSLFLTDILDAEDSLFQGYLSFSITVMVYFVSLAFILPLSCIYHSYPIREELDKVRCCKFITE